MVIKVIGMGEGEPIEQKPEGESLPAELVAMAKKYGIDLEELLDAAKEGEDDDEMETEAGGDMKPPGKMGGRVIGMC